MTQRQRSSTRIRPRARTPRRGTGLGLTLAALVLVGALFSCTFDQWAASRVHRTEALAEYDGRPPPSAGTDWLIVGTDSRAGLSPEERRRLRTGHAAGARTDTIMLLHLGASRTEVISIPRDSYIAVPSFADSRGVIHRAGRNKINVAYGRGGPPLLTRALERATGLRLDHYAEVDFSGFVRLVDSLGGVRMCLDRPVVDRRSGADLRSGCQMLHGSEALAFVRARYVDPEGDLGRVRRQQRLLAGLADRAAEPGVLLNPTRLAPLLEATTVDGSADPPALAELAVGLARAAARGGRVRTVPVADPGFDTGSVGEVVLWDVPRAAAMFRALREDRPLPE